MCLRTVVQSRMKLCISTGNFGYVINNLLTEIRPVSLIRRYCHSDNSSPPTGGTIKKQSSNVNIASGWGKYEIFKEENSRIILDIEEERMRPSKHTGDIYEDEFHGINLERGIHGVFDLGELIELLKRENAQDVFVASLPRDLNYVDYIIVVTGKSQRHMKALAEITRRVFKRKMHAHDHIPKIEGENSKEWIAMDLGNIALHIFSLQSRKVYDLESLWSVGSQFDILSNEPEDPLVQLLERHSVYLGDLRPADTLG